MRDHDDLIVKICGLRDAAAAQAAIDAGADALGFIMAESRRQVPPEAVRDIRDAILLREGRPQMLVGVFVNRSAGEILNAGHIADLDAVQLSGDESPAILDEIDRPVIKAMRFAEGTSLDEAYAALDTWYAAPRPVSRVIVEGHRAGSYGGTGTVANWAFAGAIAARYPIILAGGLSPENVAEAIEVVGPAGVDVSSGVETNGAKDHARIRAFVENARRAAGPINVETE